MSLANELELTYGEQTMILLEEFFGCAEMPYADRKNLAVPTAFWDWRKEAAKRAEVLNKAGLELVREVTDSFKIGKKTVERTSWTANLDKVTADTLDEAVDRVRAWNRTEKELKERARIYLRQCDAANRRERGF